MDETQDNTSIPDEDFEAIESMDSSAFLGGVDETQEVAEPVVDSVEVIEDEQPDSAETNDQNTEEAEETDEAPDAGMSDSERNAFFAQRRIAAKQGNDTYIENLKEETQAFVDDEDDSKFENMDEDTADILKNAAKMTRQMEANEAIREVQRTRETTANSIIMAESKIPQFNPTDKEHFVGEELYGELMNDWAAAHAIIEDDSKGEPQIVGVKKGAPSPYDFLESKAKKLAALTDKYQARAQTNAARNSARSEIVPVNNQGKSDSFDDLEERVGNISLS